MANMAGMAGISDIKVLASLDNGAAKLRSAAFSLADGGNGDHWSWGAFDIRLETRELAGGVSVQAFIESNAPLGIESLAISFIYQTGEDSISNYRIPARGSCNIVKSGLLLPPAVGHSSGEDSLFCGLWRDSVSPCLFAATVIPQKNRHLYRLRRLSEHAVRVYATTYFTLGQSGQTSAQTERVWISTALPPLASVQTYAELLPAVDITPPLVGWNSWDYYYTTVTQEDICGNMAVIAQDPVLDKAVRYITVDDGWQCTEGEWFPNYKFPNGMKHLAALIKASGKVPGVWTNGCQVTAKSFPVYRQGDMLIKDGNGAPQPAGDMYMVDPTHPEGREYFYGMYRRLYEDGFRLFKVDFVSNFVSAATFYKKEYGVYDAIRELFGIIREAVTEDSVILGCSFPAECGAGLVGSMRIGVDIHNQWEHLLWVVEFLQLAFWQNQRIARIDPDFMVVRGNGTSLEAETNVYNVTANLPPVEGEFTQRWRRGPVFSRAEAETWANIVQFCGGNIFLSDNLSRLNDAGMALVREHLAPGGATAVPLDLGDSPHAACWHYEANGRHHLLIINYENRPADMQFSFSRYGLAAPEKLLEGSGATLSHGALLTRLPPHGSIVVSWAQA